MGELETLANFGARGTRMFDEFVVELQTRGDGGVLTATGGQWQLDFTSRGRAQPRRVDGLPRSNHTGVEVDLLEHPQCKGGEAVTAALVAWKLRLVCYDDGTSRTCEHRRGRGAGGAGADDENIDRGVAGSIWHGSRLWPAASGRMIDRADQKAKQTVSGDSMSKLCEGRVVIVTGAGRGIGREHSLSLARHGAFVVVNDLGGNVDGTGGDASPAQQVVNEIEAMGGRAVANGDDISSWDGAKRLVQTAVEVFGDLHGLVNNAGILRDRTLVNMTEAEWDAVIQVHLKGTFAPAHFAAEYWRDRHKAGQPVDGRIINTTSVSGIYGNPGQTNYGAAKAGIAAFTIIAALELARYDVTVNAVAPVALTRMTEGLGPAPETDEEREMRSPKWIAPIVTWLASAESKNVTGRVFEASGQTLAIAEGWHRGPRRDPIADPTKLGPAVAELLASARANAGMNGEDGTWPQSPR